MRGSSQAAPAGRAPSTGREERVVVYSVTADAHYLYMARMSIKTLRRKNRSVRVRLVVFGDPPPAYIRSLRTLDVDVVARSPGRTPPLFQKWLSLREAPEPRVLFVDADTFFFDDVERLFEQYRTKDFYARQEFGFEPGPSLSLVGTRPLATRLDVRKHEAMARALGARVLPVFNSGLMMFNRGLHARMVHGDNWLFATRRKIRAQKLAFPFSDPFMFEQITASMALGSLPGTSWGFMHHEDAPFFIEWKAGIVASRGVVIHTWSGYYNFALLEFEGRRELQRASPDAALYREYRPNGLPKGRR